MPKPLFTRLAAICAVGLFCVLFGCVYALSQKDTILLVMSLLLGVCCIIRFLLLYQAVKAENYRVLEGICVKREKSPLTRNQQVLSVPRTEKNTVSAWKNTPGFWLATATGSILKRKPFGRKSWGSAAYSGADRLRRTDGSISRRIKNVLYNWNQSGVQDTF